jgi:tetratricopeptide (TPR) repeat protein
MEIKPVQRTFKSLSGLSFSLTLAFSLSLCALVGPALANEEILWDGQRQMDAYFVPDSGMTNVDNDNYEEAQSALGEWNLAHARDLLEPLSQKYPDFFPVQLKLAETYLLELNPDQAQELLKQIEDKLIPQADRTTADTAVYLEVRKLLAKTWLIQDEPQKALAVLNESTFDASHLTRFELSSYHVLKSKAYESQQKWLETESELKQAFELHPQSLEIANHLQKLSPQIAEAYYRKGLSAFRAYRFNESLPLAQEAHKLNLHSQAYIALYLESHERLQTESSRRFLRVRSYFAEGLTKIRWALEVDDIAKARQLYEQLLLNEDISFLLQPVPRSLLPLSIQQTLTTLDRSLKIDSAS